LPNTCTKCNKSLSEDVIIQLLKDNKEITKKYFHIKNEEGRFKDCPIKDCYGHAIIYDKNQFIKCSRGHEICIECDNISHQGKSCEEVIYILFI